MFSFFCYNFRKKKGLNLFQEEGSHYEKYRTDLVQEVS